MKKLLVLFLGCTALAGVCGDFFALPADKGKDLPGDKVFSAVPEFPGYSAPVFSLKRSGRK